MLRDAFMFCDLCLTPMGQLWALPAQAPGLIDCPRDCICPDCQPLEETPCWSAMNVGWVMSDDNTKLQKKQDTVDGIPVNGTGNSVDGCSYPAAQILNKIKVVQSNGVTYAIGVWPSGAKSGDGIPSGYSLQNNCTKTSLGYDWNHATGYWPTSATRVISVQDVVTLKRDLTDTDYNDLDPWVASQSASWLKMLLSEVCGGTYGGVNPQACYDGLQKQSAAIITGPATVQGPKTTSTGTYTRADGTTGTTSSTTNTTYNITYGDQFFDYTTNTTTTNMKDGQVTDTNTTTDAGTPQEKPPEDKPEEDKEQDYVVTDTALPKVDPFYEQQYPDGLQGVWNEKQAEFQDSAFVSFLHSFVPSFSGSCPAFSLSFAIAAWANYGTIQFSSICYALDLVKVVILVSALFLCRALIFGG